MDIKKYLITEASKPVMRKVQGLRVIEGWKNLKRLYVHRVKNQKAYMVTHGQKISLDDMVEIDGDYWWGTLKQLKQALENDK